MLASRPSKKYIGANIDGQEYRDEGCEISPSCLRCPLPRCKHDDPQYAQAQRRRQKDSLIVHAHVREGLSVAEVARRFGLTHRTILRILRRNGYGKNKSARARGKKRRPATTRLR